MRSGRLGTAGRCRLRSPEAGPQLPGPGHQRPRYSTGASSPRTRTSVPKTRAEFRGMEWQQHRPRRISNRPHGLEVGCSGPAVLARRVGPLPAVDREQAAAGLNLPSPPLRSHSCGGDASLREGVPRGASGSGGNGCACQQPGELDGVGQLRQKPDLAAHRESVGRGRHHGGHAAANRRPVLPVQQPSAVQPLLGTPLRAPTGGRHAGKRLDGERGSAAP